MSSLYKRIVIIFTVLAAAAGIYYLFVAKLPMENLTVEQISSKYQYQSSFSNFEISEQLVDSREFTFTTFDGEKVFGQIALPKTKQAKYPVLIGIHAMGRSYPRWFKNSLKGRPTVTKVNKITEHALNKGYAVLAIDARFHGKRKVADKPLRSIWNDLHFFGDKTDYENMVLNTVIDHRVLIDWIATQAYLDSESITVAGYSMGGQISLILQAVDRRVVNATAIVPPFIDNRTAAVAPYNLVTQIKNGRVLYIYGENDDVASSEQNKQVFNAIGSNDKELISYNADHILPEQYVNSVAKWLQ